MNTALRFASFAVVIANVPWHGFVLSWLWGLFVVPLGVPAIGIAHAIGLILLAGVAVAAFRKLHEEDEDVVTDPKDRLLRHLSASIAYGLALLVGIGLAEVM